MTKHYRVEVIADICWSTVDDRRYDTFAEAEKIAKQMLMLRRRTRVITVCDGRDAMATEIRS